MEPHWSWVMINTEALHQVSQVHKVQHCQHLPEQVFRRHKVEGEKIQKSRNTKVAEKTENDEDEGSDYSQDDDWEGEDIDYRNVLWNDSSLLATHGIRDVRGVVVK